MVCKEKLIVNIQPEEKELIIQASKIQKRSMNSIARIGAIKEAREILKENLGGSV